MEIVDAHAGGIYSVAFSPDGTKILTASADKTVKQWNVSSLACEATYTFAADPQLGDMQVAVLWTPMTMLSLSLNGNINILNPDSPSTPSAVIPGHQAAISAMYLDKSEGGILYTGSADGVMIHRSLATGISNKIVGVDKRSLCLGTHSPLTHSLTS
jgi:WD40 repeat protein